MMLEDLVEQLLALPDSADQGELLRASLVELDEGETDALAEALLEKVIELQRSDLQRALETAKIIQQLSDLTGKPVHRATGLRAEAQVRVVGLGEYQQALPIYAEAKQIFQELGDEISQARIEVTRIWALASLGRYEEAIQAGEWAGEVLEKYSQWRSLAGLKNNLAMILNRRGKYVEAREMLDAARTAYLNLGEEGRPFLAKNELNRALVLSDLGHFEDSIQAGRKALQLADEYGQKAVAAVAQHNLGSIYSRLGRHNEALNLYAAARETHLELEQPHEAAICDLSSTDSLLELGRYNEILKVCQKIYSVLVAHGMRLEAAETIHNQARAYAKQKRYQEAIDSLGQARSLYEIENNQHWIALTDLDVAVLKQLHGEASESLEMAQQCDQCFMQLDLPVYAAQSKLIAAQAATSLDQYPHAADLVHEALSVAEKRDVPFIKYQGYQLLGRLSKAQGDCEDALCEYSRSITELERLKGNVITEYQADFLEDKQNVYEETVSIYLDLERDDEALAFAERAKSQALKELLAFQVDLGIRAKQAADEPLVAEIEALREQREQLLSYGRNLSAGYVESEHVNTLEIQNQALVKEDEITSLWHNLLLRNSEYERDVSLWEVHAETAQPYLDVNTALVEYFTIGDEVVLFLVTSGATDGKDSVRAYRLSTRLSKIERLLQNLRLNLHSVPRSVPDRMPELTRNIQGILEQLYSSLLAPVNDALVTYDHVIIVPHAVLHYLPFHALYDGESYIIEKWSISYLPGASFLSYFQEMTTSDDGVLSVGNSSNGDLPYAILEANMAAELFGGKSLLESGATIDRVCNEVMGKRLLHFACHGEFRPDNPLFSGLELSDGWLTTLEIFNLRLQASLVTLSACQTGRSVVGGGDELLGLMRAFLAAGAASLVLSQWAVEDRSTCLLMEEFYQQLVEGESKDKALQTAQLCFIHGQQGDETDSGEKISALYAHPYYWAPYFLIGDSGEL